MVVLLIEVKIIQKPLTSLKVLHKKHYLYTMNWYVYMLECADGTLYTGITNDIEARIAKHNSGKGAKYTRARLPVQLKTFWDYPDKVAAAKAEYAFKQLSKEEKLKLIAANIR